MTARYAMLVDLRRCVGCASCQVSCKMENGVAVGGFRARVQFAGVGAFPNAKRFFLPLFCNQSEGRRHRGRRQRAQPGRAPLARGAHPERAAAMQAGAGSYQIRYTADVMCPSECGLEMWVRNGQLAKIYGNKAVPFNDGACCAKGAAGQQLVYSPLRLKYPMIRVGARGEGILAASPDPFFRAAATLLRNCPAS